MKEFYLVAVGDNPTLHDRVGLDDAELRVIGEVPASVAEYFDVQPGEILCVMAVT
jgi:molybdopterin biosynthesis enzyme